MEHKMPNFHLRRRLKDIIISAIVASSLTATFGIPIHRNMVKLDTARKVHQTCEVVAVRDLDGDGDLDVVVSNGFEYNTAFSKEKKRMPLEDTYFLNNGEYFLRFSKNQLDERIYEDTFDKVMHLANRNKNGVLEFTEQVDAWRRMGFKDLYVESRGESQFQKPKLGQLGNAIASYKAEGEK